MLCVYTHVFVLYTLCYNSLFNIAGIIIIIFECAFNSRGRGPLKSTMDVINAAKKISEAGTKMDKMAKTIADQVRNGIFLNLLVFVLISITVIVLV